MLYSRKKAALAGLMIAAVIMVFMSGCELFEDDGTAAGMGYETESETESETETETESESETELQFDIVYISEDGSVRIILPDSTWKVSQDIDEMRVFSSGSAAMINIVHADDESSMQNISVMRSQDELVESLIHQYPEEDSFEILSFEERRSSTVEIYEYVVNYTYPMSMWAYSVTYGILARDGDAAYVVSGTVTNEDPALLDEVKASVESFSVLDSSSIFSVLPGVVKNNDGDSAEEESDQAGEEELSTLTEYLSSVTLYASHEVNVREKPSTEAGIVGTVQEGEAVSVTGETLNWFQIDLDGIVGYVSNAFLVYGDQTEAEEENEQSPAADADSGEDIYYGDSSSYYATTNVNLRSAPGTDAEVEGSLTAGSPVTVIGESGDWFVVSLDGAVYYVSKAYVASEQAEADAEYGTGQDYSGSTSYSDSVYAEDGYTEDSYVYDADAESTYTDSAYSGDLYEDSAYTDSAYTDSVYTDSAYTDSSYTENNVYTDTADTDASAAESGYTANTYADAGSTNSASAGSGSTDSSDTATNSGSADSADTGTGSGDADSAYLNSVYGSSDSTGTSDSDGTYSSSSTGMLTGTVSYVYGSTVTILGSDGGTYYIDYEDAGGLTPGSWVTAMVDYSQETDTGALYATSVY